ncbi:hypothetical protein [Mesorhizobium sp. M0296]|uniref:hypothetical protein n=1 Tax=Mesorhizobium sp. M0296 TaxID=2956931 RepID=UPI00333B0E32
MFNVLQDWRAFRNIRRQERQRAALRQLVDLSRTPAFLKERLEKFTEIVAADPEAKAAVADADNWKRNCDAHVPVHDAAIQTAVSVEDEWREIQLSISMLDTLIVKELRMIVAVRDAFRRKGCPDSVTEIVLDSLQMLDLYKTRADNRRKLYEMADGVRVRMAVYTPA